MTMNVINTTEWLTKEAIIEATTTTVVAAVITGVVVVGIEEITVIIVRVIVVQQEVGIETYEGEIEIGIGICRVTRNRYRNRDMSRYSSLKL